MKSQMCLYLSQCNEFNCYQAKIRPKGKERAIGDGWERQGVWRILIAWMRPKEEGLAWG